MGLLIEGIWHDQWYDTEKNKGEFVRSNSQFRTGLQKMVLPVPVVKKVLQQKLIVIIFTFPSPVPGHIGH
ncbi:MAG: hypothetical protein CM1200mP5_5240 [Candidatus Pelagibacterales bacterium]|nr:MAG: hypothetical protein CM1200mP5_5240 [Pelagibacterales bacterium]